MKTLKEFLDWKIEYANIFDQINQISLKILELQQRKEEFKQALKEKIQQHSGATGKPYKFTHLEKIQLRSLNKQIKKLQIIAKNLAKLAQAKESHFQRNILTPAQQEMFAWKLKKKELINLKNKFLKKYGSIQAIKAAKNNKKLPKLERQAANIAHDALIKIQKGLIAANKFDQIGDISKLHKAVNIAGNLHISQLKEANKNNQFDDRINEITDFINNLADYDDQKLFEHVIDFLHHGRGGFAKKSFKTQLMRVINNLMKLEFDEKALVENPQKFLNDFQEALEVDYRLATPETTEKPLALSDNDMDIPEDNLPRSSTSSETTANTATKPTPSPASESAPSSTEQPASTPATKPNAVTKAAFSKAAADAAAKAADHAAAKAAANTAAKPTPSPALESAPSATEQPASIPATKPNAATKAAFSKAAADAAAKAADHAAAKAAANTAAKPTPSPALKLAPSSTEQPASIPATKPNAATKAAFSKAAVDAAAKAAADAAAKAAADAATKAAADAAAKAAADAAAKAAADAAAKAAADAAAKAKKPVKPNKPVKQKKSVKPKKAVAKKTAVKPHTKSSTSKSAKDFELTFEPGRVAKKSTPYSSPLHAKDGRGLHRKIVMRPIQKLAKQAKNRWTGSEKLLDADTASARYEIQVSKDNPNKKVTIYENKICATSDAVNELVDISAVITKNVSDIPYFAINSKADRLESYVKTAKKMVKKDVIFEIPETSSITMNDVIDQLTAKEKSHFYQLVQEKRNVLPSHILKAGSYAKQTAGPDVEPDNEQVEVNFGPK